MKKLLAENMQRFGVKNLTESDIEKITRLTEGTIKNSKLKREIGDVQLDLKVAKSNPVMYDVKVMGGRSNIQPVNKIINVPIQIFIQGRKYSGYPKFSVDTLTLLDTSGDGVRSPQGTFKEVYNINQTFETGNKYHKFNITANTPPVKIITPQYSSRMTPGPDGSYAVEFRDQRDYPSLSATFSVKGTLFRDTITPEAYSTSRRQHSSYTQGDEAAKKKIEDSITAWMAKYPNGYTDSLEWSSTINVRPGYFIPQDVKKATQGPR